MDIKRLVVGSIATNAYLISDKDECILIDPGGSPDLLLAAVKDNGAKPVAIVNTHYHFDHVLANDDLREKLSAPVWIHEAEKEHVGFHVDRWLKTGEELAVGEERMKVLLTPGHTHGSICLEGKGYIFTGDTLFLGGYGRTDLPGGSDTQMEASLKRLTQLIKPGTMVYPGHGDFYQA